MTAPTKPLSTRALTNAASQIGGRIFLSGLRFIVMLIVVKHAGVAVFGEFALILTLVLFSEVLADFGMNDVAVREVGRDPGLRGGVLGGLIIAKGLLVLLASTAVIGGLIALRYPRSIVEGAVAVLPAIACYGGVLLFRLGLKGKLRMEKEVAAESISVIASLPAYLLVAHPGVPLYALTACHSLSRLVFLCVLVITCWDEVRLPDFKAAWGEARHLGMLAYPIGIALLVACSYDGLDLIMLSKLRTARDVGLYSGSMRFVQLSVMLIYPIADTAFPMLVSRWHVSRQSFQDALRTTFRISAFLAGGALCVLSAAAGFLLHSVSREMLDAQSVLQVLALVAFGRALMTIMQPLLIVSNGVKHALWLTAVGITLKMILLLNLVPVHGAMGAAITNVIVETVSIILATAVVQALIGFQLNWGVMWIVVPAAAFSLGAVYLAGLWGSLTGGLCAGALYSAITLSAGVVPPKQLFDTIRAVRQRMSNAPAPMPV
jgi:O-antigen/teichoic acid export membrane protein